MLWEREKKFDGQKALVYILNEQETGGVSVLTEWKLSEQELTHLSVDPPHPGSELFHI